MGTSDKRFGKVGDLAEAEIKRKRLQAQVDADKSVEERRKFGQFATPLDLAKEIISYGLKIQEDMEISFLEPAFGTGAFYSALLSEMKKTDKVINSAGGFEMDKDFYHAASIVWEESILLSQDDFTESKCFGKTNFLISNPPYVRHHFISQKQKAALREKVKNETGIELSGLAGLYCYFMLLAHKWLATDAICGWLIPSEFMDVNYGSAVKRYLLENVHLLKIHRYAPDTCQFDDALVSSCVVWFKNEKVQGDYEIDFSYGGTHDKPQVSKKITKAVLAAERKWTRFPVKDIIVSEKNVPTLGDYFNIKRGLATGDNSFFILTKAQIERLHLDMAFFSPILPSPRHLRAGEIFQDEKGYPLIDPQYFLLDCAMPEIEIKKQYPQLWKYLEIGKETTAGKYLCRNRKMWYMQERRAAAPFLCSYMGRSSKNKSVPFRFILNHSKAAATNSYLMLYPKGLLADAVSAKPETINKIWEALKTITADDFENEGRVYGGGLKKIEPRELSNVKCLQLAELFT